MTGYSVPAQQIGRPAAWWGMTILIASESTLFGCFIGTYFYLRFQSTTWPPGGIPEPEVVAPLILVAVLVSSVVPMRFAANAAQTGRLAATRWLIALALVLQIGFFAYGVHDFSDQLDRFDITPNAYSSIYYTLLGADHAHVLVGILFNLWLLGKLARGFTRYRINAVRAIALYWYAVSILTVAVFATLLSARL
jgi:heme/copper-type cytochrome/quinol oxidase subunit 3